MINKISNAPKYQIKKNVEQKKPVFKGFITDSAFKCLSGIEKTPVIELCLLDLFGMIMPRTIIDLKRNKKELGHYNWDAGRETAFREITSSAVMFFLPGVLYLKSGKFLNNHFNKEGVNTKSFMNFNNLGIFKSALKETLKGKDEIRMQDLKKSFADNIMDKVTSTITSDKVSGEIKDSFSEFMKDNQKSAEELINEVQKPESLITKAVNLVKDLFAKDNAEKTDDIITEFANKIKTSFGESKINLPSGKEGGTFEMAPEHFIRDSIDFIKDIVHKGAEKAGITDGKINPKELLNVLEGNKEKNIKGLYTHLNNFKFAKIILAVGTTLGVLLALPKANILISKLIFHNESFPGLRGIKDNHQPQKQEQNTRRAA